MRKKNSDSLETKLMAERRGLYRALGQRISEVIKSPEKFAAEELRGAMQAVIEVDGFLRRAGVLNSEMLDCTDMMQVEYLNFIDAIEPF